MDSEYLFDNFEEDSESEAKYLIFKLEGELYGTPLMGVREILAPQNCKPIPGAAPYFLGIFTVRGRVTGAIDLKKRFASGKGLNILQPGKASNENYEEVSTDKAAFVVFDTAGGAIAAFVDKVEAVLSIAVENIDKQARVSTIAPLQYYVGIAQTDIGLVSIIDLKKTLSAEDFVTLKAG